MSIHDSNPIDPADLLPENIDFVPSGTQGELFVKQIVVSFGKRAADSIDPRDMILPNLYRIDEHYKRGE